VARCGSGGWQLVRDSTRDSIVGRLLGIEVFHQLGRTLEVGEQRRDGLALALGRFGCRARFPISGSPQHLIHFIRHWSMEIVVALALAIVAAIIMERHERQLKHQAIENDLKAVATPEAFDSRNKLVGHSTAFFLTPSGVLVTSFHVIKGADE
jgi:hypothetical protein